ncbi:MAG: homoserine dehydrogenase [Planctomycetota bacterium]|jgi:homoserine dehydrogenase
MTTTIRTRTLRVGLLGLGTVGEAVCTLLRRRRRLLARKGVRIEPVAALVRTRRGRATDDARAFLHGDYDCVVEAMGGVDPAFEYVRHFLDRGVPVVTANKALLAERGGELAGRPLLGEAAVAAGIPLLRTLDRSLHTSRVDAVAAILNGTSNYALSRIARGATLDSAIEQAQRAGFAEADPTLDLDGTDAAQKLSLLAGKLGVSLPFAFIERSPLEVRPADCRRARALGHRIKPVAWSDLRSGFVAPALVPENHPLALIDDEQNGVVVDGDPLGRLCFSGPGAGGLPTAASIVDDLIAVAKGEIGEWTIPASTSTPALPRSKWFVTLQFSAVADAVLQLLHPIELRRLPDEALPTYALITSSEPDLQTLRALRALTEVRAFRVL